MTKAERTRQLIIEKSAPIFNIKGVAGTSLSDILKATKLAKGSLYVHFENKEAISQAVVDYFVALKLKAYDLTLGGAGTATERLHAYIDMLLAPISPVLAGGCPCLNFGMEADDTDPIIRDKIKNIIAIEQQRIVEVVEEGKASGEFKRDLNATLFALKIYALIEGSIMLTKIYGDTAIISTLSDQIKKEIQSFST